MRKAYSKPEIMFEDFTLSTNIAGNCESIVDNASKGSCSVNGTGGVGVFSGEITGCDYSPEDLGGTSDQYDGACYHVPTEGSSLFNS